MNETVTANPVRWTLTQFPDETKRRIEGAIYAYALREANRMRRAAAHKAGIV